MANSSTKNELKVWSIYNFIKEKPISVPNYPRLLYLMISQIECALQENSCYLWDFTLIQLLKSECKNLHKLSFAFS